MIAFIAFLDGWILFCCCDCAGSCVRGGGCGCCCGELEPYWAAAGVAAAAMTSASAVVVIGFMSGALLLRPVAPERRRRLRPVNVRGQAAWQPRPERPLNHLDSNGKLAELRSHVKAVFARACTRGVALGRECGY